MIGRNTYIPELRVTISTFLNPKTSMIETWKIGGRNELGAVPRLATWFDHQAEWQHNHIVFKF
jgi:hypothetical protein